MTFEEYRDKHYSITSVDCKHHVIVDGWREESFDSKIDAEDYIHDSCIGGLNAEYRYHCDFCNAHFNESDIEHRIEDTTFTAPLGSTIVIGGDVSTVPVCPICKDDMA